MIGATVCLFGVAIILLGPRPASYSQDTLIFYSVFLPMVMFLYKEDIP